MSQRRRRARRWRRLEKQPETRFDWPDPDNEAVEYFSDPILVYDNCNGYSLWSEFDPVPPPAEWWIALPDRDKLPRRHPVPGDRI